jgi:hypothetical protein
VRAAGLDDVEVTVPAFGALLARDGTWFLREVLVPAQEALEAVGSVYVVVKAVVAVVGEGGSSIMTCTKNTRLRLDHP